MLTRSRKRGSKSADRAPFTLPSNSERTLTFLGGFRQPWTKARSAGAHGEQQLLALGDTYRVRSGKTKSMNYFILLSNKSLGAIYQYSESETTEKVKYVESVQWSEVSKNKRDRGGVWWRLKRLHISIFFVTKLFYFIFLQSLSEGPLGYSGA